MTKITILMIMTRAERTFTTFEAARVCGVFHTTVTNWVNKGKLRAHATPGGHRRIRLPDLLDFMQRFDMPIPHDLVERPKRVLVVDDVEEARESFARAVKRIGSYEVASCSSGVEALIAIGKELPDLLILDVRMPDVNGFDVCRVLRSGKHTEPIKILAITGAALSSEEERFLTAHADGFLRKPAQPSEIKDAVLALLEPEPEAAQAAR